MFTEDFVNQLADAIVLKLRPQLAPDEVKKSWPALMTLKVAREYSGYSISKLKELIASKQLPTASMDTKGRIRKEDLDAAILRSRN